MFSVYTLSYRDNNFQLISNIHKIAIRHIKATTTGAYSIQ